MKFYGDCKRNPSNDLPLSSEGHWTPFVVVPTADAKWIVSHGPKGVVDPKLYCLIRNEAGGWWNGTTFEPWDHSHFQNYVIPAATRADGIHTFMLPYSALPPGGPYLNCFYHQAGAMPSNSDELIDKPAGNFFMVPKTVGYNPDGVFVSSDTTGTDALRVVDTQGRGVPYARGTAYRTADEPLIDEQNWMTWRAQTDAVGRWRITDPLQPNTDYTFVFDKDGYVIPAKQITTGEAS